MVWNELWQQDWPKVCRVIIKKRWVQIQKQPSCLSGNNVRSQQRLQLRVCTLQTTNKQTECYSWDIKPTGTCWMPIPINFNGHLAARFLGMVWNSAQSINKCFYSPCPSSRQYWLLMWKLNPESGQREGAQGVPRGVLGMPGHAMGNLCSLIMAHVVK